jgi:hypothetical protein
MYLAPTLHSSLWAVDLWRAGQQEKLEMADRVNLSQIN